MPTSLVIGGTGVTGIPIVNGLLERGHAVTIINSGTHPPPKELAPWNYDGSVEKKVAIAHKEESMRECLGKDFYYDHVFSMYGNLRKIAKLFGEKNPSGSKRCGRFYSIGGPVLAGMWNQADSDDAIGGFLIDPLLDERSPVSTDDGTIWGSPNSHSPKIDQMVLAEQDVFRSHPNASHFRYPIIYGPLQLIPIEWWVVKRCLDRRPFMIMSEELLNQRLFNCYCENAAQFILRAVDYPSASQGEIFQVIDSQIPTWKQWALIIARAMGHELEIIGIPSSIAACTRPMMNGPTGSKIAWTVSNQKARQLLGYEDTVPVVKALERTAHYLAANPPTQFTENLMQDPFDYAAEDNVMAAWNAGDLNACREVEWSKEPGYGHFYYGPHTNPGDGKSPQARHQGQYDPTKARRDPNVAKL